MISKIFSLILVAAFSVPALAFDLKSDFTGFVKIDERELYVVYAAPKPGKPTVVLLNGLTYTTKQWRKMTTHLQTLGLGVVRYDMNGMGETLLKYGVKSDPYMYADQATDLDQLLKAIGLQAPYNIVGLSYGGGIALAYGFKYPSKVKNAILMAPYTEPLEAQDTYIKQQITATRTVFPLNPYSDEQLYDYFLRQICYLTYPTVEPIVLENPYKLEAVFRMTQGIRKYLPLAELHLLPKKSVHLMVARQDQYIPAEVLERFWNHVPQATRASRIFIQGSEHKIPEAVPAFAAGWVNQIVSGNRKIKSTVDFEGQPGEGTATDGVNIISVSEKN